MEKETDYEEFIPDNWGSFLQLVSEFNCPLAFERYNELMAAATADSVIRNMIVAYVDGASVVPGDLQRPLYVNDLSRNIYNDTEEFRQKGLGIRVGRGRLLRSSGTTGEYIMSEDALRLPEWLGRHAMHDQLLFLLEVTAAPSKTSLRVMPDTDHKYHDMTLFYPHGLLRPEKRCYTYLEGYPEVAIHDDSIGDFEKKWDEAWNEALPVAESRLRIERALDELDS